MRHHVRMPSPRRPRRAVSAVVAAVVLCLLAGCGLGAPEPEPTADPLTARNTGALEMTAWQPDYSNPDRIDASKDGIDVVSVASVALIDEGAQVSSPTDKVLRQLHRAHSLGKKATLLVTNSRPGTGFSRSLAAGMLQSPAHRLTVAVQLARIVDEQGWDGVMLDFEAITGDEAPDLVEFARDLRDAVGPGVRLEAAIPSARTPEGYRQRGYDIPKLAAVLDHVTMMAYDQHGTWNPSAPGPVGAIDWQTQGLDALLTLIAPDQVDLGVAGYGYRWGGPLGARSLGDVQARRLVQEDGATATFDETAKEWTATLSDGSVFWWSDARSLESRIDLAERKGLHGVAVWSLAVSDPITRHPR